MPFIALDAEVLDEANGCTCISAVAIDNAAYEEFLRSILSETVDCQWLPSDFVEKLFGTRYHSRGGHTIVWHAAGRLPFTHCVANKLVNVACDAPLVIPLCANSVVESPLSDVQKSFSLYDVLTPIRVIAGYDQNRDFPPVIVLGIHDAGFVRHSKFKRKVKEAFSKNWPQSRLSTNFVQTGHVKAILETDEKITELLGWGSQSTPKVIQQATLELEKKVLRFCCNGVRFVRGSDLVEKPDAIEGGSIAYLARRHFVTAPQCSMTHGMPSTEDPKGLCLIDGKFIEEVLMEIEDYSEVAKKAFEQHGLVPGDVVIDVLKSFGDDVDSFLSVFRHYGIFILPAEIKCGHDLAPAGVSPRDNFRLPISLPEPADMAYIIPHLLSRKKLPSELQSSYLRTEAFAIRHKGGLRISESLFYFLVAIFIKHYPNAPRCYYRAARLRVERGHILELKLQDDVILAYMLVQTSDESFQVTGTAKVCSNVKAILMDDAKKLNKSYLAKQLQFGAVMKTHDHQQDFVDLESQAFPSRESIYSEEGEDFVPHRSMYLWYNRYGPEGTMLEKNFAKLSEEMPAEDVVRYLIDKEKISGEQYIEVKKDDSVLQSSRLLLMLSKRKLECDSLLYDALGHLKLYSLAELMKKQERRAEATENAQVDLSEEDQHHKKTVVAQPVQDNEDPVNVSVPSTSHTENAKRIARMTGEISTEEATSRLNISRTAVPTQAPSALPFTPPAAAADLFTRSQNERGRGEPPVQSLFEAKYWHVERASDYFNERPFREGGKRLGSGSFGTVYHGVLHSENGQKYEVAIKRLKNSHSLNPAQVELNRKQFGIEIHMLTRYVHKNIIALVGFSTDGPELCLIFEYMANGALSHRLDCRNSTPPLQWQTRLTISYDIACGLDFLHTEYRLPVIHRDVKSSNVLLTSNFTAKLSDFGLAVIGAEAEESVTSTAVGTRPYMPPEAFQKIVTPKLDVYGFGVIMYELGTGLPPYSSKKKQDLKSYVDDIEGQGIDLTKMLDPKAKWPKGKGLGKGGSCGLTLLEVAKKCTLKDYTKRASIRDVLQQLADISK